MPSPFGQFFRKNTGDSSGEPAINEDLECGHGSSVPQTPPTASGYQFSPSRVYLPETQSILTSMVPRTPIQSREYLPHDLFNSQHPSAEQEPVTPSGLSRVLGYLPRTLCNDSPPFLGPTRLIGTSQPPKDASNETCMGHSGPQSHPTLISGTGFSKSPSPGSSFDPVKHGQALRTLETHGSFKTVSCSEQEHDALSHSFAPWSPVIVEDHAAGPRNSYPQRPESWTAAESFEMFYQHFGFDLLSPTTENLPNSVGQPLVCNPGEIPNAVNLPDAPEIKGGQNFREALPSLVCPLLIMEIKDSSQFTQQAQHRTLVPHNNHQGLPSKSSYEKGIAADALPDLPSTNPSSEKISEDNRIEKLVHKFDTVTKGSEQYRDLSPDHVDGEEEQQRLAVDLLRTSAHQAHTLVQSPMFEETNEYLWSPAPSDDSQEAPSVPHTPILHHALADALPASLPSGFVTENHIGFPWSTSCCDEQNQSRSSSSSNGGVSHNRLPHIDVLIPAGHMDLNSRTDLLSSSQYALNTKSRRSSSMLFRYSGIITDGASSRPTPDAELGKEVLRSLEDRGKTGLSMLSLGDSICQVDRNNNVEQLRGEHEPIARPEEFLNDQAHIQSTDAGPGSSQTSSSRSISRYTDLFIHKERTGNYTLPSMRARCPTPPLLFGKHAISEPERANKMSRSELGVTTGRLNQDSKATGPKELKETGRLPKASCSLGEQDWETVSAGTEAHTHAFNSIHFNAKTGSSLADNSDSGRLSLSSKEKPYPFHRIQARPIMQYPAHPRHNHSFMLLKNIRTGDLVQVPQYKHASGGCLPNSNASSQLASRALADSIYQHPSPLRIEHNHPFNSSPPIIRFTEPSVVSGEDKHVVVPQSHLHLESSSSGLSEVVQEVKKKQTDDSLYKTTQDVLGVPKPGVNQNQHLVDSKEQSHQSSAWSSTVSEFTSSESSLHVTGTGASFTKMVACVNGAEVQGGNRQVGSSLADASSTGADFSSSPAPLARSIIHFSDIPPSLGINFHKQVCRQELEPGSLRIPTNSPKTLTRSFDREDSVISTSSKEHRSRSSSACGLGLQYRKSSPCRRRSSSESHSRLMESPCCQKAPAMNSSSLDSYTQQITTSGLLLRNPFLHSDENDSRSNPSQQKIIERRGRQAKPDNASIGNPTTPSSTGSPYFVRNGIVHTDAALPVLYYPVPIYNRPWDRVNLGPLRPSPLPNPLTPPLLQRPVARAGSPHLHRIPHMPSLELLERHKLLSRIYLLPFMMIPPTALIYGHGYMDGIMRLHTAGEINGFRSSEKSIALCWGYGLSGIIVFAVVIAMVIISGSA